MQKIAWNDFDNAWCWYSISTWTIPVITIIYMNNATASLVIDSGIIMIISDLSSIPGQ